MLDPERALIHSYSPLRAALSSCLPLLWRRDIHTYVLDAAEGGGNFGFVQVQWRMGEPSARVICLAPPLAEDGAPSIWRRLLIELSIRAGERGIQRLLASLPEDGSEAEIFQQVGFVTYAKEEILYLEGISSSRRHLRATLRRQGAADRWALQRLHSAATPRHVQGAEGGMSDLLRGVEGYVLEAQGELVGHLRISRGERGYWLRMLLHPQARERAGELVEQALLLLSALPPRPIYCGLRGYQDHLKEALWEEGFRPLARRSLVAKRIAARIGKRALKSIPVLERRAEAFTRAVAQ